MLADERAWRLDSALPMNIAILFPPDIAKSSPRTDHVSWDIVSSDLVSWGIVSSDLVSWDIVSSNLVSWDIVSSDLVSWGVVSLFIESVL